MIGRSACCGDRPAPARTNVHGESGAVDVTPDATVAVNIARFDVDDDGALVLAAQIGMTFVTGRREDLSSGLISPCQPVRPISAGRSWR
jgi:hypothetical protein